MQTEHTQKALNEQRSSCPIACGLDLLGDKWSLLVIRDLMLTNRSEFGHFLNAGEGISTNILSDRLLQLQQQGLVSKTPHPNHGKKFLYALTAKGRSLAPVIVEFALWAHKHVDGAEIPELFLSLIEHDRESLLNTLQAGEPLYRLEL